MLVEKSATLREYPWEYHLMFSFHPSEIDPHDT